jgi:hypothetical protein
LISQGERAKESVQWSKQKDVKEKHNFRTSESGLEIGEDNELASQKIRKRLHALSSTQLRKRVRENVRTSRVDMFLYLHASRPWITVTDGSPGCGYNMYCISSRSERNAIPLA